MRDLERSQVALDGGPRDSERGRRPGPLELPTALTQHVVEQCGETVDVAEPEQTLNVASEERVHPLAIQRRALRLRAAPPADRRDGGAAAGAPRTPRARSTGPAPDAPCVFVPRECRGTSGRGERRRARREIRSLGKMSAPIFRTRDGSRSWWISSKTTTALGAAVEERRIADHLLGRRQIAVDVQSAIGESLASVVLPSDARRRATRCRLPPGGLDAPEPERTLNHATILYI